MIARDNALYFECFRQRERVGVGGVGERSGELPRVVVDGEVVVVGWVLEQVVADRVIDQLRWFLCGFDQCL